MNQNKQRQEATSSIYRKIDQENILERIKDLQSSSTQRSRNTCQQNRNSVKKVNCQQQILQIAYKKFWESLQSKNVF